MSTYQPHPGAPVVEFHDPVDMADFQKILDRFNARHPVEPDAEQEKRADAILWRRRLDKSAP